MSGRFVLLTFLLAVPFARPASGRDLVIDAGVPVRVRVVTLIDGKSIEDRQSAWIAARLAEVDADSDGRITPAEWSAAEVLTGPNQPFQVEQETSREELAASLRKFLGLPVEIVVQPLPLVDRLELFQGLDGDGDAFVTQEELSRAVLLLNRYDADGDGTLTQPELAPTEPLQPMPLRSGKDFPPGRFPFHWENESGQADYLVEIRLIGQAFGRPRITVKELHPAGGTDSGATINNKQNTETNSNTNSAANNQPSNKPAVRSAGELADDGANANDDNPPVPPSSAALSPVTTVRAESRKVAFDAGGVGLDVDAVPARITTEDIKRFFLLQLRQRDADKNGYLSEEEFLGLGLPGLDFKTADANGDGMLFPEELRQRLDLLIARETSRARIEASFERQPLFAKIDADGDDRLSRRELLEAARSLADVDVDGDGRVGLAEFGGRYRLAFSMPNLLSDANPQMIAAIQAMPGRQVPRETDGPAWFAAMDRNADGDLARREFLGSNELFRALDVDGDGLLSSEEALAAESEVSEKE